MSLVTVEGRLEGLPVEVQQVMRELAQSLNELRSRHQRGAGSPESRIVGYRGYTWERTDGGAKTCLYVFEGVDGATTGWQQLRT